MTASAIEQVFEAVRKNGKSEREGDNDSKREGSYVRGVRTSTTTSTLATSGYTVQAVRIQTVSMSPAADITDNNSALTILQDEKTVFRAKRYDGGETKEFGAQERYLGTKTRRGGKWVVVQGTIPPDLDLHC